MQIFGKIIGFVASRPAAITVLFFYAMDHLFGNVAFDCPCTLPKELRRHFAMVLLFCPAFIIVFIDIPWSLLFSIIKVRACCCQEACSGAFMAVVPPLGFSIAWIFIFQESEQFSVCINATNMIDQTGCIEDSNSREYIIRTSSVVLLCLMTSALGLRAFILVLAPCCNRCCKSCCESCCKSCCEPKCISCCKWLCKFCLIKRCRSCADSCCKSCCDSCSNSCCDCLTIHPNSVLLKENLSFETFHELEREHLLIEEDVLKGFPVERIDKLNIGQGQQVRLKNQRIPGPVQSLKASTNGKGVARVTWKAPNNVKGKDIGYIIQYKKITNLKQRLNQQNRQQKKSTAKLRGLECNVRYSIHIWVIQNSDLSNSEKKSFCSIEICTTETTGQTRIFRPETSQGNSPSKAEGSGSSPTGDNVLSGEVWKFSLIQITQDSVSLKWNLEESDQREFIGYELQYKIVKNHNHEEKQQSKNQNHEEKQQSKTEMSAEFSTLQADVRYQFEIWACKGNTKGESSSIEIDGGPDMMKELLCNECYQSFPEGDTQDRDDDDDGAEENTPFVGMRS